MNEMSKTVGEGMERGGGELGGQFSTVMVVMVEVTTAVAVAVAVAPWCHLQSVAEQATGHCLTSSRRATVPWPPLLSLHSH